MKLLIGLALLPSLFRAWRIAIRVAHANQELGNGKRIVLIVDAE